MRRKAADATGHAATWRLDLQYEGTRFKGWAMQPGQRTVEGELEHALQIVLRERVRLSVAGRTDAGVHALAQVASFACRAPVEPRRLQLSLNALLPADVAVRSVTRAPEGFEARAAAGRTYRYRLWLAPNRPVHERAYVWPIRGELDQAALAAAAELLVGRHDFAALTPSAHLYHSCVREVRGAVWLQPPVEHADELWFEIGAGSFLHNMVRVAVGSMVDVAQGRLTIEGLVEGLASGERRRVGSTAPARGLALVAVSYERPARD